MVRKGIWTKLGMLLTVLALLLSFTSNSPAAAQTEPPPPPEMLHPRLDVRPVITGLNLPNHAALLPA